jgi:hypothetical protein
MRRSILLVLALITVATSGSLFPSAAQEIRCYKKTCVEYPDGSKVCELRPVDCSQVQIQ